MEREERKRGKKKRAQVEKIKAKAQKLSQALVDIEGKKRKAVRMENGNRLPKRWKSSAEHAENEEKIH